MFPLKKNPTITRTVVDMTKNAATSHTLNMEEEKFVFNDELVINVVVTIQAQYTSIKQKPLVEKVSPLKSVSGSESSSDPILPPPAVKEYKKPLPNSKTSFEGRSDQVSCEMMADGVQLCQLGSCCKKRLHALVSRYSVGTVTKNNKMVTLHATA